MSGIISSTCIKGKERTLGWPTSSYRLSGVSEDSRESEHRQKWFTANLTAGNTQFLMSKVGGTRTAGTH